MLFSILLGDGYERQQRLFVILGIAFVALVCWMYLGKYVSHHAEVVQDPPLVITNTEDLRHTLSNLHYGKPVMTQLEYGKFEDVECRQVRSSVSGLPVGMIFSPMGAIHGVPQQKGFFPFFYRCSFHGQEVAGSLPIMVY